MLSVTARRTLSRPTSAWSRSIHVSRPAQGGHGAYTVADAVPFSFKNKNTFALKVISYFGLGLALPVVASAYQLAKK